MPMAIDTWGRRRWLQQCLVQAVGGVGACATVTPTFAKSGPSCLLGLVELQGCHQIVAADVRGALHWQALLPGRAHGLAVLAARGVWVVSRRPGDWMEWRNPSGQLQVRHWIEPGYAFCGHVLVSPNGRHVYTTETSLDDGAGHMACRDARTLTLRARWPTHGRDPHELVWCPPGLFQRGTLMVANGGLLHRPETGRQKLAKEAMAPSLVALDAIDGSLRGQWTLPDARLSIRHLAWGMTLRNAGLAEPVLGVALQAEHDDGFLRQRAPVLALWRLSTGLRPAEPAPMSGYGGSIVACEQGWAVSSPRAGCVGFWSPDGGWIGATPCPTVCALAVSQQGLLVGSEQGGRVCDSGDLVTSRLDGVWRGARLDNHWLYAPDGLTARQRAVRCPPRSGRRCG